MGGLSYDRDSFQTNQILRIEGLGANQTSVIAADSELAREKMMAECKVTDFNVRFTTGATTTGDKDFIVALAKSVAGTGALVDIGTVTAAAIADGAFLDATLTADVELDAGDHLVAYHPAGTALPAGAVQVKSVSVKFNEMFD